MSEQLPKIVVGLITTPIIIAVAYLIMGTLWSSSAAPEPGDPFFGAMVATTDGAIAAFGLLSLAGILSVFGWLASQAQSF